MRNFVNLVQTALFLIFIVCEVESELNLRPVLGIITQKTSEVFEPLVPYNSTYIASSYVKFLEMAGAEVVPIISTWNKKRIERVIRKVNGVLLPGGAAPFNESSYWDASVIAYKVAVELNNKGVYYPLFGICLGFETLHEIVAQENSTSFFDSENLTIPLNFTQMAYKSRLFKDMSKELMQSLLFDNITLNMHKMGVSIKTFQNNEKLKKMFQILSTNLDRDGREFVSTVEGIKYPFYGTQWHPEKNIFEWTPFQAINHGPTAVKVTQHFANFFVNEARRNKNKFASEEELESLLIMNYKLIWGAGVSAFGQIYIFQDETFLKIKKNKKLKKINSQIDKK
ncbi:gamma-glutamyl hydrolase A [Hydra vulgaris]|uniref:gamma-glutamyl hydrolase A n=1 Tax=Hydra vulgaris TaxID=6087 RepID=UPI0001925D5B|nr:gamma-glutamyl hydrolase A [Hydra vulgaris]